MIAEAPETPPEISIRDLRAELAQLHDRERNLITELGRARLEGRPWNGPRQELQRIRESLEANYAALRLLLSERRSP